MWYLLQRHLLRAVFDMRDILLVTVPRTGFHSLTHIFSGTGLLDICGRV